RSLAAFVVGLLLASLYGAMALFLQNQPLWFCAYTSVVLGSLVAFGMGLSAGVRADVMVMLPTMCSRGRNFILLLFVSTLLSGPMKNTLENTQRAASSLLCGAELAANQTQELMQRAATPLFVVDKIREISSNAYAVAGRVQNFINSLTDSVRHVRTLRNVLHFLVDIGDICNDKLGAPYRKCRDVFAEARTDCVSLLGEFSFLCDIMDGFLPLCNIARTVAAFKKMMREFDFNITASVQFDVNANRSRSLQQVSQEIMAEISSDLQMFQKLGGPLRAVQYRRRYLRELSFDNIYINAQFKELEQQVTSEGGASVLPLTRREAQTYITPVIGSLLVSLDFLVFWILDQVYHQVKGDVIARPVSLVVRVNGSGYASDIFRDLVASFNILQRGNITVISRKCLMEPSEPNYITLQQRIRFLRQQILDQRRAVGRALRRSAARNQADRQEG
uniref:DC-STAMP domain containing 2 n=1 Tax=Kryptolebias marmoratus TaxID=37003 RepID=A0A3Q3G3V2_KRYMA